jgi:hypothetical protein
VLLASVGMLSNLFLMLVILLKTKMRRYILKGLWNVFLKLFHSYIFSTARGILQT